MNSDGIASRSLAFTRGSRGSFRRTGADLEAADGSPTAFNNGFVGPAGAAGALESTGKEASGVQMSRLAQQQHQTPSRPADTLSSRAGSPLLFQRQGLGTPGTSTPGVRSPTGLSSVTSAAAAINAAAAATASPGSIGGGSSSGMVQPRPPTSQGRARPRAIELDAVDAASELQAVSIASPTSPLPGHKLLPPMKQALSGRFVLPPLDALKASPASGRTGSPAPLPPASRIAPLDAPGSNGGSPLLQPRMQQLQRPSSTNNLLQAQPRGPGAGLSPPPDGYTGSPSLRPRVSASGAIGNSVLGSGGASAAPGHAGPRVTLPPLPGLTSPTGTDASSSGLPSPFGAHPLMELMALQMPSPDRMDDVLLQGRRSVGRRSEPGKLPLHQRAVHVTFLERLRHMPLPAAAVALGGASGKTAGTLTIHELRDLLVKPATQECGLSLGEALTQGWITDHPLADAFLRAGRVEGPTMSAATYYLAHPWSLTLNQLCDLIRQHYEWQVLTAAPQQQAAPPAAGGHQHQAAGELPWAPAWYWIDVFAVSQHHDGAITQHPDGRFESVIRSCQGLLLAAAPHRQPAAVSRLWCVWEVAAASMHDVPITLLLESEFWKAANALQLQRAFQDEVLSRFDATAAEASSASDAAYLQKAIEASVPGGPASFNTSMRALLAAAHDEALLLSSVCSSQRAGSLDAGRQLLQEGAMLHMKQLSLRSRRIGDLGASLMSEVLLQQQQINDDLAGSGGSLMSPGFGGMHRPLSPSTISYTPVVPTQLFGLTALCLHDTDLRDAGAVALAQALRSNQTLTAISLGGNPRVTDLGWRALARALELSPCLTSLSLRGADLSPTALGHVAQLVRCCRPLSALDLGDNRRMDAAMCGELCSALIVSSSGLTKLVLSGCKLDAPMASSLAEVLQKSEVIKELELQGCSLGDPGLTALAAGLSASKSLLRLVLSDNGLGPVCAEALGRSLAANTSLQALDLSHNPALCSDGSSTQLINACCGISGTAAITAAAIGAPGASGAQQARLTWLDLSYTGMCELAADTLIERLGPGTTSPLADLRLRGLPQCFGDASGRAVSELAEALRSNSCLTTLDISHCALQPAGARALVSELLSPMADAAAASAATSAGAASGSPAAPAAALGAGGSNLLLGRGLLGSRSSLLSPAAALAAAPFIGASGGIGGAAGSACRCRLTKLAAIGHELGADTRRLMMNTAAQVPQLALLVD